MPLDDWRLTKNTLHLYLQIVGKIRLAMHPRINHWWHVPLYVSPLGLTTRAIPYRGGNFEIEFNFKDHQLEMRTSGGGFEDFALFDGLTVCRFLQQRFCKSRKARHRAAHLGPTLRSALDNAVCRGPREQVVR